jgi:hypothetical protein
MIEALFSCCHFGKFLGGYFPRDGRLQGGEDDAGCLLNDFQALS